ncbi:MAG: CxxC-x17-CxxC domain-containing protein [Patescibacteria group bacterium]|nr:CxxC-x17-CxxC domain-containing protein [Patescibacteria group bacterium]
MGNFNKGGKFGGGNKFSGNRGFGGGRGGDRQDRPMMHRATCDDCGNNCEVPFRPTGERPVFCRDCFQNKRDDSPRHSGPRFGDKPRHQREAGSGPDYKVQFEQLNSKLDRILRAISPIVSEGAGSGKSRKSAKKEVDTAAIKDLVKKTVGEKAAKKATAKKPTPKKSTKKTATKKKK